MPLKDVLNRLVDNAFTYLEKGLGEVDLEINFSLLHFYGGIELAVKACLLNEDWKLVVDEPGDADLDRFCNGKQRTVGLPVAAKRLEILKSKPIDPQAIRAFEKLSTYRNQLTHFFRPLRSTQRIRSYRLRKELLVAWYVPAQTSSRSTLACLCFNHLRSESHRVDVKLQALEP